MAPKIRTERRIVTVNVVDLAPGLTIDAALIEGLCEVDGRHTTMVINDVRLRERLAAAGWINIRGSESCYASSELKAVARELGLY